MKTLYAALIFFTRLPFWRLYNPPADCFKRIVNWWWFAGIVTGSAMAGAYWLASHCFAPLLCVAIALGIRMLVTGALHEDGLADFFDGFGGGTTKERILAIMKDSFIGSYGVLGLIMYALLFVGCVSQLPSGVVPALLLFGDILCKALCSYIIEFLPYARKEEESKAKVIYERLPAVAVIASLAVIAACILLLYHFTGCCPMERNAASSKAALWAPVAPVVLFALLVNLFKRKIGGYTGDCCGAIFLLCELSFYLAFTALYSIEI